MFADTEAVDLDQSMAKFERSLARAERQLHRTKALAADLDEIRDPRTGRIRLVPRTTSRVRPYDIHLIDTAIDTTAANHWVSATPQREKTPEPDILDQLLSTVDDELTLTDMEEAASSIWHPEPARPVKPVVQSVLKLPSIDMTTVPHHTTAIANNAKQVPTAEWTNMSKKQRKRKRQWLARYGNIAATTQSNK